MEFLRSRFFIKLRNWEYWPFGIVQFPAILYFPWLAARARSLTFFCGSNPGITMGGLFGESKFDVLSKIPQSVVPKTILVKRPVKLAGVLSQLQNAGLAFPLIFKPDLGERGFMVKRIAGPEQAQAYIDNFPHDFICQELVDLPLEFGVFYARLPEEREGKVTSVVAKEMLSVTGNGINTLRELILRSDRARLQWDSLQSRYLDMLDVVVENGKKLELVSIGNHCLGTKFLNANHLINERLNTSFDKIGKQIPGFYFGRFDLRCASLEDLYEGNVKVVELNGCGAEPAHIYDPDFSLLKAAATIVLHWKTIFTIAEQNRKRGFNYLSLRDAVAYYREFKSKVG